MNEGTFANDAGLNIFYRTWQPSSHARAVVVIVHGFNSHSGRYLWAATQLTMKGASAYALDLRGRGRSDGERFYVDKFDDYVADVAKLIEIVRAREPELPIFVLGHSAGGVVACLYALEHQRDLAGFICESFAFQVPAPDAALSALKGLSFVAPHVHVLKLKNEDFSRDPDIVASMNEDPLIAGESQATKTVAAMVRADEKLKRLFPNLELPLLILHGTEDKATRPSGSRLFHDEAGSKDKTLKLYEGYFHDLLNDVGRERVMDDITRWISTRIETS